MRRQPKARSTKAKFREDAYYVLKAAARSGPARDTKVDFGGAEGTRQVGRFSNTAAGKQQSTSCPAQLTTKLCRPLRCTAVWALTAGQQPHRLHRKVQLRHYGAWRACQLLCDSWTGGLCRSTVCLSPVCSYTKELASAAPQADQQSDAAAVHALHSSVVAERVTAVEPGSGSLRAAQGACWHKAVSMLVSRALLSSTGHCAWQLGTAR